MQTSMFYCPIVVKGGSLIITIIISMIIIISSSSIPIITAISHSSYCWLMLVKKTSSHSIPLLIPMIPPHRWLIHSPRWTMTSGSSPRNPVPWGLSGGWDDFRTWRPFLGILNITNIQVSVGDRIILSPFLLGDVENQDISFTFPLYHPFCWFSHHFSCLNLR